MERKILMNPPGPELQRIFDEALNYPSGGERSAYLDRACGDDLVMRGQVEALLLMVIDDEDEDEVEVDRPFEETTETEVLTSPGPVAPPQNYDYDSGRTDDAAFPELAEAPGARIGPYQLLLKIGQGGMGVVFLAEQEKPIRRRVALKVIKPGLDTAQVIARFEAERQALAIMDHPNIARVLDGGATDTGRPFFVMELVNGVPITEYCDRNHLSLKERLELFLLVCQAIQHAHQKGIIHRDIKPSNVLVTLLDGVPQPKVIDFGVAKAIDQRLTEETIFTEFGKVVGTLEYMSPEQADISSVDVDTRTDVYSLGVLLYELLTGSTPLERKKLRWVAYAEILRQVREVDPPKPSTRLSESKDSLASISAQRKMEPGRLPKFVQGDLDWIVMKSLDKDRTRRYESASGLARDIQRSIDGDAVEASPPSASYRLRKFARRHRVALATVGAFALLLIAATAVSARLAVWAIRERDRAFRAEASAREQEGFAQKAATSAKQQQRRAVSREQMAINAVKRYGDVVRDSAELKNNPALAPLRKTLMKEPQTFFEELRDQLQEDRETTADSLDRLAMANEELAGLFDQIGDKRDALRAFEESRRIRERLVLENPSVSDHQRKLAASIANLANSQIATGHPTEALATYERARVIQERLVQQNPTSPLIRAELASTYHNLGNHFAATGSAEKALASYEASRLINDRLVRENPLVAIYRSVLAGDDNNIGIIQRSMGHAAEALASFEYARRLQEQLFNESPTVDRFQYELAMCYANIGIQLRMMDRMDEALKSQEKARSMLEKLVHDYPSVAAFQLQLSWTYNNLGAQRLAINHWTEALRSFEQAQEIEEKLVRDHPESPDYASVLGGTLNDIATIDFRERRFDEARIKLLRAIDLQRRALAANPHQPQYRKSMSDHLGNLVRTAETLGRADEADQARRDLAELDASDPAELALDARLAAVIQGETPRDNVERLQLADRAYRKTHYASSARLYAEAFANAPKLTEDRQSQPAYNAACAATLSGSGVGKDDPPPDTAARTEFRRQALDWLRSELSLWSKILDSGPAESKANVAPTLQHWKRDADLASIRDEEKLARLPETEQAGFRQLWADVDQLLGKASGSP